MSTKYMQVENSIATVLEVKSPPFFAFGKWYVNVSYMTSIGKTGVIELPHDSYEHALKTSRGFTFNLSVSY